MRRLFVMAAALVLVAVPSVRGVDTTIKGERMELLNKGEEVLFSGGVRLDRGNDTLLARTMRTNQNRDRVNVKGDVKLTRKMSSTETWKGFGDAGFYNVTNGTGYLLGGVNRAHLIRTEVVSTAAVKTADIFADRIDFYREGQRAFAKGNVYGKLSDPVTGDVYEFRSEEAEHRGAEGCVVLTGATEKPVVTHVGQKRSKRITGKKIIYYIQSRRLVSTNNAEAVLRQEK